MISQDSADDLLSVLKKLNIEIGNINPCVIKAWFDTDSEDLLKWICSSITEANYVSPQETKEFSLIEKHLTSDELHKELKSIETEFPDLFQCDLNLFEIGIAEDTTEVLEEQLKDYEIQLKINQQLNHNLSQELARLTSEKMKSNLERESTQENCLKVAKRLDKINDKSYDQILKYHTFLSNYGVARNPEFINNMEITELEQQFLPAITWIDSTVKVDNELLNTSMEKNFTNILLEMKNRISESLMNCLVVQMESEALSSTLKFLDKYDLNTQSSFREGLQLQLNMEYQKSQQKYMMRIIQESFIKKAEHYISQPMIQCCKNELNCCRRNLNHLDHIKKCVLNFLSHLVVMYNLYLEEKVDISSSNQFFKNVMQYVQKDLQNNNLRREAMMNIIEEYKNFTRKPIEQKFRLIGSLGTLLCKSGECSVMNILKEIELTKDEIKSLEEKYLEAKFDIPKDLTINRDILLSFLTRGPTHRIVTISHDLRTLLDDINSNLNAQDSAIKSVMEIFHKSKGSVSENKWINHRRLFWIYFITDPGKMLSLLKEFKNEVI